MTAFVGDILSATAASVTGAPTPSRTWAWLRGGSAISGQTASTYRVTETDVGSSVSALQTETNFIGAASAASPPLAVSSWSPSLLFSASEPGIWLDPSDLTTMFQDRFGSDPVTAPGQFVGLRLDASQGLVLGSELVTNGTFDSDVSGWQDTNVTSSGGTVVATSGEAVITRGTARAEFFQTVTTVVGRTYTFVGFVTSKTGSASWWIGTTRNNASNLNLSSVSVGQQSGVFTATATTTYITMAVDGAEGQTATIDNVSVKELPGNHARANADLERGIYGVEPLGGRRNLLTFTEQFDNAAWLKSNTNATANAAVAPDGTTTAETLLNAATAAAQVTQQNIAVPSGISTYSTYCKAGTVNFVSLRTSGFDADITSSFNLSSGAVFSQGAGHTASITPAGSGWYRCVVSFSTASDLIGNVHAYINADGGSVFDADLGANGTSSILIWGAQLETGSTATAYQRVVDQYNVTEAGVTTLHYVQYDGSNDGYVTPTITPGTDKVQVFAGVRKLSDAARGTVVEHGNLGTPTNGSFFINAPLHGVASDYSFASAGTSSTNATYTNAAVAAPVTSVISGLGDINGDRATLRINGTQAAQSTADQGTGNYLAYPLYIGRRGGTTLPFNGRDYGIIVRFGANLSSSNINRAEYYVAQKTGVTL